MAQVDEPAVLARVGEQRSRSDQVSPEEIWRLSKRFDDALVYAASLHREQHRKGTTIPYIAHLLQVAGIVLEYGGNEDEAIAALLHDAAEDQGGEEGGEKIVDTIRRKFGDPVAGIVAACSDTFESSKPPWRERKQQYIDEIGQKADGARLVSAADKLHNARAILMDLRAHGEDVFKRFNGGKAGTFWYYRALIDAFRESSTCPPLVNELNRVVSEAERLAYPDTVRQ